MRKLTAAQLQETVDGAWKNGVEMYSQELTHIDYKGTTGEVSLNPFGALSSNPAESHIGVTVSDPGIVRSEHASDESTISFHINNPETLRRLAIVLNAEADALEQRHTLPERPRLKSA